MHRPCAVPGTVRGSLAPLHRPGRCRPEGISPARWWGCPAVGLGVVRREMAVVPGDLQPLRG
ncbi:MAG: hypothetical protein AVDCRST_MAG06-2198 [uncultured Nocardioides sp.]|uniref:Uncharacterized protein n=1 Tax=uncultured Nocardioides sp. TaxID=198441 RepID=A0A6J4NYT9_9ACTN|nr:MAG: hypothetical protein AVDCRST_MAG06-2198 [uncultured Nocardioides sp.]